jgi:hypothetical protein
MEGKAGHVSGQVDDVAGQSWRGRAEEGLLQVIAGQAKDADDQRCKDYQADLLLPLASFAARFPALRAVSFLLVRILS